MKYMIFSMSALLICYLIGYLVTGLIVQKRKAKAGKPKKILGTVILGTIFFVIAVGIYLGNYYHADEYAKEALKGTDNVSVTQVKGGYFFDGPGGDEEALIFYPGAKVEGIAYAPLLSVIAEQGRDCFLAEMPMNMAMFGMNAADRFMEAYSYERWDIAGHSMGGMIAASYASSNPEKVDQLVLIAAYPTKAIDDSIPYLSVYGSEDGCLERKAYETGRKYWPKDSKEVIVEGGNHSGVGSYGFQNGDGKASIPQEEEWKQIADAILTFCR